MRSYASFALGVWLLMGCGAGGGHDAQAIGPDAGAAGAAPDAGARGPRADASVSNSAMTDAASDAASTPVHDAAAASEGGAFARDAGLEAGQGPDSGSAQAAAGGSAAARICPTGVSYGDPLSGMGAIEDITAPSGTFSFVEGPVWVASLGTLFFSDNAASPAEQIWKLVPPNTTPELFKADAGANGIAVDNDDRLVVCDQARRALTRVDPVSAEQTVIVDHYMGNAFNSPNDAVVHHNGTIYFTDPPHGLKGRASELGYNGIFQVSPEGELSLIESWAEDRHPNGVVLSIDERTLFVSEDNAASVWQFALDADGHVLGPSMTFAATGPTPDGMAVDCAGHLYVATGNGIEVFGEDGAKIGTVPQPGSNCTFGGDDRKTLYITDGSALHAVRLNVPGLPD